MFSFFKNNLVLFILQVIFLWGCGKQGTLKNDAIDLRYSINFGIQTSKVNVADYQRIIYVSESKGVDEEDAGMKIKPFKSISYALSQILDASSKKRIAVLVSEGYYCEDVIQLIPYIDLLGGFSAENWERDIERFVTELNAESKHRILIGANNVQLDGFLIREGLIKGKGAGIFCEGTSPKITNNVFYRNKSLGPDSWEPKYWHKTANDGGAVYCVNGAEPIIRNNIFIENKTENGRGAAIACQTRCQPHISYNIFAYNITGLEDPMRSSDGGAVSIFDWCSANIENNIFIGNRALSSNDAGGVFVALWSSAEILNNIFVDNHTSDDAGALFVGGQEHRYDAPLDPLPSKELFFVNIEKNIFMGNQNPSKNSGAMRFTMESRGRFAENLVVHNSGIYFQRSEVLVENNIILDNFLFIETKDGLNPGIIRNNIIWANFSLLTPASVINNNIKGKFFPEENYSKTPQFEDNLLELSILASSYSPIMCTTELLLPESIATEQKWVNRIVRAGDKWGVVKSFKNNELELWGDVSRELKVFILPSYHLKN